MKQRDLKLMLVGDARVGKSEISSRFCLDEFDEEYKKTIGVAFFTKEVERKGDVSVKLAIWDTAGNLDSFSMVGPYVHGLNAVAVVLDGTKSADDQRESMSLWVETIRSNQGQEAPKARIYFIVNKTDQFDFTELQGEQAFNAVVTEWNEAKKEEQDNPHQAIPVMFCSAKTGTGITEAFEKIIDEALQDALVEEIKRTNEILDASVEGGKRFRSELGVLVDQNKAFLVWEDIKTKIANNKLQTGGTVFILVAWIALLIVAASPVGVALAVGVLSGTAVSGIAGAAGLLLWNLGCVIGNTLKGDKLTPLVGGGEDEDVNPSARDNQKVEGDGSDSDDNGVTILSFYEWQKTAYTRSSAKDADSQEDEDSAEKEENGVHPY